MLDAPKTKEEAKKFRYGEWAGNPKGNAYIETRCAYEVWSGPRGMTAGQCCKSNGHGPNGLYCKVHARKVG